MPSDSTIQLESLSDVRNALGAVRSAYGECAEFFTGVFARLESVSDAMKTREQSRDRQLLEFQRQQQLWDQERTILERELEAVRNRAAELSEALEQQKRDAATQQTEWAGELKRMRRTLQQMAHRLVERAEMPAPTAAADHDVRPRPSEPAHDADPVLNSVMAQFEILQNDAARRREAQKN